VDESLAKLPAAFESPELELDFDEHAAAPAMPAMPAMNDAARPIRTSRRASRAIIFSPLLESRQHSTGGTAMSNPPHRAVTRGCRMVR
jgi:hypothetical protein